MVTSQAALERKLDSRGEVISKPEVCQRDRGRRKGSRMGDSEIAVSGNCEDGMQEVKIGAMNKKLISS